MKKHIAFLIILLYRFSSFSGNCDVKGCDKIATGGGGVEVYVQDHNQLGSDYYEVAKRILDSCDCWWNDYRGGKNNPYNKGTYHKLSIMVKAYETKLEDQAAAERQQKVKDSLYKLTPEYAAQIAKQREDAESQKKAEMEAQQKHQEDSLQREEALKEEITTLLTKPGKTEECFFKCKQYSEEFGQELDICNDALFKRIKALTPSQITSQEVADIYFTPRTEIPEWYMDGKETGYLLIGGQVSWVANGIAEMSLGSNFPFLIKFSTPWVVREGLPLSAYGKPVGNVTYRTALGGLRTLPCLKLVWMYRPSKDKISQPDQ